MVPATFSGNIKLFSQIHGPEKQRPLNASKFRALHHDLIEDFLQQARHGGENMWLHFADIIAHGFQRLTEVNGDAPPAIEVNQHALIHMANGQKTQGPRTCSHRNAVLAIRAVGSNIAMTEHHPFGHSRSSRGVNQGGQIFGFHGIHHLLQGCLLIAFGTQIQHLLP